MDRVFSFPDTSRIKVIGDPINLNQVEAIAKHQDLHIGHYYIKFTFNKDSKYWGFELKAQRDQIFDMLTKTVL